MDWAKFNEALQSLDLTPGFLMQNGPTGDNKTIMKAGGEAFSNTEAAIFGTGDLDFGSRTDGCDFVWTGSTVRIGTGFFSGGHPTLAGLDVVNCAGRVEKGYFFFHSGHYRPKEREAFPFLCDFVAKSCADLKGSARDDAVDRLSKVKHEFYVEYVPEDSFDYGKRGTYRKSLAEMFRERLRRSKDELLVDEEETLLDISGPTLKITRSKPIPIGGKSSSSMHSTKRQHAPKFFKPPPVRVDDTFVPISPWPTWQLDSDAPNCTGCDTEFTFFTRRHHCRACGKVFCDKCTQGRKLVKYPATPNKKDRVEKSTKPVRVCHSCS
jgi:hypothetical protein